ncbi:hypothetical protein XJ44_07085 [Thermosipho affectus]|uniref:Uncharacterized protein n=2 Tax=Fervidobacteriaceae TaxID=1643950 RepID=A0ABX3IHR7_9BACT|nr:hypothetical protein Y592_07215 [Thermosipho sp. 1070]APT72633.1 hypothetical protein BG95_07130 [Thermosipho sp. 1063]ONN26854.1 hypothetical protein XJ44_07085 [Thermosipho affectus]OOC42031.1 hypothetical protein XO08_06975 [Thermosipho sp. 1074]
MFDKKIIFLWSVLFIFFLFFYYPKSNLNYVEESNNVPRFILPYEDNLWIVSSNGKIIDIVDNYKVFSSLPVIVIPIDEIDYFRGKVSEKYLKNLSFGIPNFVYEINFVENYMVLNNNSKVFFNENFDFKVYFEKLKIVYKYIEPNEVYYFSNDRLIKAR